MGLEDEIMLIEARIKRFKDTEFKPKIGRNIREKTCFFIHDSSLPPAEWALQLDFINHAMKYASAGRIVDVLPYLRFSRQDKKDESRVCISARVIADHISDYASSAMSVDVHAEQIQGFYSIPFDNLYSSPTAVRQILRNHPELQREDLAIMGPDENSPKRAKIFRNSLIVKHGLHPTLVFGYKSRPRANEIDDLVVLGDVKDRTVILVDDILDSGRTLIRASNAVKELGAKKVYGYVTHGLFTDGFDALKPYFEKLFVGNTLPPPKNNGQLEVVDLCPLLSEAIYRTATGQSLSELFDDYQSS